MDGSLRATAFAPGTLSPSPATTTAISRVRREGRGAGRAVRQPKRETANLREAVLRYRIEHPVVNDRDFAVWNQFGGRAWPTLMFVDPQGRVIGKHEGELPFEQLDPLVGGMLKEFEARAILDPGAAPIALEQPQEPARTLKFPGKVLATDDAIYVADTNHHRIVKAGLDGSIQKDRKSVV